MNIKIVSAGLCLTAFAVSIALAQSHKPAEQNATRNLAPSPLATAGKEKAVDDKVGHLDDAAELAQKRGDYAEAEEEARQAVALNMGDARGQEILAAALDAQGKTQEALQAYKMLSDEGDVFPSNELPYAQLLLKTGHWAEAVEAYNRQLPYLSNGDLLQKHSGFSPNVPRPTDLATAIHIGLGQELGWRGYHGTYQEASQQAQGEFQKALALEPDSSLANYYVGYGLKRMGRRAEAQAAFKKAAALDQGDVRDAAQKELPETIKSK